MLNFYPKRGENIHTRYLQSIEANNYSDPILEDFSLRDNKNRKYWQFFNNQRQRISDIDTKSTILYVLVDLFWFIIIYFIYSDIW